MATHLQEVKPLRLEKRPLILLLILTNLFSDGKCQTIQINCPSFKVGSTAKVICSVPTSNCQATHVFFDFKSKDGIYSRLCSTSTLNACGLEPVGNMNCGCVFSDSISKKYQLNFFGDKSTYEGGELSCNVNCVPVPERNSCQSIRYAVDEVNSPLITDLLVGISGAGLASIVSLGGLIVYKKKLIPPKKKLKS